MIIAALAMDPDCHIIAVTIFTLVPKAGIELDHLVIAVEGDLVCAQLDRQLRGCGHHELAQLLAPVLVTDHHVLQPPNTAAAVDELLLNDHGGRPDDRVGGQVLDDNDIVCAGALAHLSPPVLPLVTGHLTHTGQLTE